MSTYLIEQVPNFVRAKVGSQAQVVFVTVGDDSVRVTVVRAVENHCERVVDGTRALHNNGRSNASEVRSAAEARTSNDLAQSCTATLKTTVEGELVGVCETHCDGKADEEACHDLDCKHA